MFGGERFVLLSDCPTSNKKVNAIIGEPKKQEPEIVPPVPEVEAERNVPEIPPDKDAPERKAPARAEG